jgi:NADH-quinone oxidoreductase subunit L
MSDEQDMRKMGGIWRLMPWTYAFMWIGSLALMGIPFFAGYFSKDIILESAFASESPVGMFAFSLGIAAAVMTAFYSCRLIFMTFHQSPRADHHTMEHVHESPPVMLIPLAGLAIGAVFSGLLFYSFFVGEGAPAFWGASLIDGGGHDVLEAAHHSPLWVKLSPLVAGIVGIATAWWFYIRRPGVPASIARVHREAYLFLLNKWYFDELYDLIFVRPAKWLGRVFWRGGDAGIIDRFGPDGLAAAAVELARRASALQSGYVYHYAFAILIGVAAMVTWYFTRAGA